jgi:hypothetical protein
MRANAGIMGQKIWFNRIVAVLVFSFLLQSNYQVAVTADPPPTNSSANLTISGSVSGISGFEFGFIWVEAFSNNAWTYINNSRTDLTNSGTYSSDVDSLDGASMRVVSFTKLSSGSYLTLGDSFTATSGTRTVNLANKALNIKINATPVVACAGAYLYLEDNSGTGWDANKDVWVPYILNQSGVLNLSLPSGYTNTAYLNCSGNLNDSVTITTTNALQTFNLNTGSSNLTGQVNGVTSENDVYAYIESQQNEDGQTTDTWNWRFELWINADGKFSARIPDGTYRVKVVPNPTESMQEYVTSVSDTFTIAANSIVKNVSLSNVANVSIDVLPLDIAIGSYYSISKKIINEYKGTYFNWYESGSIKPNGKIKSKLEPGIYRIEIQPKSNLSGYVNTPVDEFEITNSGSITKSITLRTANLTINTNLDSGKTGSVNGCNSDYSKCFDGVIGSDGKARVYAESGTYTLTVTPDQPTKLKTKGIIENFVATGSTQSVDVVINPANVSGTISPSSKTGGGTVSLMYKSSENSWDQVDGITTNLSGEYYFYAKNGTYKLMADCSKKTPCVTTWSPEFTIASDSKTINVTVVSGNVTGTISPTNRSKFGFIGVELVEGTEFQNGYMYSAPIKSDGKYELKLPKGKYKLRAEPSCQSDPCPTDYVATKSDTFEVIDSVTAVTKDLTLQSANISGTIYPVDKARGGWANVEKLESGNWTSSGDSFGIQRNASYALYLNPGTYRFNIQPGNMANGVSRLTTDSFTVTSSSQTLNFTLPESNFQAQLTPANGAAYAGVLIEKSDSQKGTTSGSTWVQANSEGKIEAFLRPGQYRLLIWPQSDSVSQTFTDVFTMPDTSTLTKFTFALNQPNVSGTVTPLSNSRYSSVCLESFENGAWTGNFKYCDNTNYQGKFKFKVANGTYRALVNPSNFDYDANTSSVVKYAQTISSEFTISNDSKTVDIALSTGNVKGVVSPTANSAGGRVEVLRSSGSRLEGTSYSSQIDKNGNYSLNLPDGQYRMRVYLQSRTDGSVNTETGDFTASSSLLIKNIMLDTPTITGQVTPVDKSGGGWINAEQYSCKCGWSGWQYAPGIASSSSISSDGTYELKVQDGLTRLVATPNWSATGVTRTYSDSFTATSSPRTVNIALSAGNISGVISSVANSAGGWVSIQQLNDWGWNWGGSTSIKSDGSYNFDVPTGTYRLIANPGWNSNGVVETVSDSFTVTAGVPRTVSFTLEAPNVSGAITNLSDNVNISDYSRYGVSGKPYLNAAWATILQLDNGGRWVWTNRTFGIKADGNYSINLKPGTYKYYIHNLPEFVSNVSADLYTDSFTVTSGANTSFSLALPGSNLKGSITPSSNSAWGWVCAQQYESLNNYWYSVKCATIKNNGSYEMKLPDGVYRVEANPNSQAAGYARTYSDSFTVSSSVATKDLVLSPTNVQLTVLDSAGKPNWQGTVEVRDSNGNFVDTFKGGWISELGKVDFKLNSGTYNLIIQPGQYSTGVRTTSSITVPSSGNLVSTISLIDGNVQGSATKNGLALPCAFVTATATGRTTQKTLTKSDGRFILDLQSNVTWTITVTDPSSGNSASATLTPGATSTNPVSIAVS